MNYRQLGFLQRIYNVSSEIDNKAMKKGINQLLGKEPYRSIEVPTSYTPCIHESDGFDYADDNNTLFTTLSCAKCGEYYDKPKN